MNFMTSSSSSHGVFVLAPSLRASGGAGVSLFPFSPEISFRLRIPPELLFVLLVRLLYQFLKLLTARAETVYKILDALRNPVMPGKNKKIFLLFRIQIVKLLQTLSFRGVVLRRFIQFHQCLRKGERNIKLIRAPSIFRL